MKNGKRLFVFIEMALAAMVLMVALLMLRERRENGLEKVSVIVQNSDDNQWAAFRYGLEMAAEDYGVEVFVVSTGQSLTADEERELIETEIGNGAGAVIVNPVPGKFTMDMLKEIDARAPVILVESEAGESGASGLFPVVQPDNYEMGKLLAEELLRDYGGDIRGMTLGILSRTGESQASEERERGFRETLEGTGVKICWTLRSFRGEEEHDPLSVQPAVDVVAAFDDDSLTAAGECATAGGFSGAYIYGIGHSTEAAYYLDTGVAECVVVPDEFSVGYQSLAAAAGKLAPQFGGDREKMVSCTVIRRDTLFTEENQEILFTMSQ